MKTMLGRSQQEMWDYCKEYLDVIENSMKDRLKAHSVMFWMHLYRRIGVKLSDEHEGLTDSTTLGLVRQIAELALIKYGNLDETSDLKSSKIVKFGEIFGGYYKKVYLNVSSDKTKAMFLYLALRKTEQLVITSFIPADFIAVYAVEGLAYEYWRVTALMRSIGKGAKISSFSEDWIKFQHDPALSQLIRYYDQNVCHRFGVTLAGTWCRSSDLDHADHLPSILVPFYNVQGLGLEDGVSLPQFPLPPKADFTPNFLLGNLDLGRFQKINGFLAGPFFKVYGFSLDTFFLCCWALANSTLMPARVATAQADFEEAPIGDFSPAGMQILNLSQRGYSLFVFEGRMDEEVLNRAEAFGLGKFLKQKEIPQCLSYLTVDKIKQKSISLWSNGPKYLVIPFGAHFTLVDVVSTPNILENLFVGVRHSGTNRGYVFEEEFRDALRDMKVDLTRFGTVESFLNTNREIDAAVRVGTKLILFECLSKEKPLDFEISRPITMRRRKVALYCKFKQALSLREFIVRNPVGKNYDFSWATQIEFFVVSPFTEWVWSRSPRFWYDEATPRIMSADSALSLLGRLG